ncbi:hypothetical protein ElyMa_002195400 [Elysia marginata]|uniref:CCDC92/74 N-terminal domain-containing protein n=1 Tax=Elysia marginata TaxID=1093978 RepID=A0AAV4FQS3_9GAST|nr:hypothetical protein ElyMa_002195400 [Elysia marginata]
MEWSSSQKNMLNNRNSQDSAVGSCKNSFPFQDSQGSGLSQIATQDLFSQNISSQNNIEANKPSSLYEKFKSRQAMMKHDSYKSHGGIAVGQSGMVPGSVGRTPYLGLSTWDSKSSIHSMYSAAGPSGSNRGKQPDSDDRKLMEQMICMIRDCNVECFLSVIRILFFWLIYVCTTRIANSFGAEVVLEKIWIHEEALKKIIEEEKTSKSDSSEIEANLTKKDAQISTLREELAKSKEDESQRYYEAIKSEIHSFQSTILSKLEKCETMIMKTEKGELNQNQLMEDCFNNMHNQQKKNQAALKSLQNEIKDSEKSFGNGQPAMSSSNAFPEHYLLNKHFMNEPNNDSIQAVSVHGNHYVPQQSNDHILPEMRITKHAFGKSLSSSVEQKVMGREFERNQRDQSFQQNLYCTGTTNRNTNSINSTSFQDSLYNRMKPFVSPFAKPEHPIQPIKRPSPCAVVEPQRQSIVHKTKSDIAERTSHQTVDSKMKKPGKKRKSVYTAKKNSRKAKKCSIEGLSPPTELPMQRQAQIGRSQRGPMQTPQTKECCDSIEQSFNHMNRIQDREKNSLNLRSGKALKTQRNFSSSKHTRTFDPYNFHEPDPPEKVMKGCHKLSRQQTRSYWGSLSGKQNNLLVTPKAKETAESPQSSPSLSVLNMTIERKLRTPFRGLKCMLEPQGSSSHRIPKMKWQTPMAIGTPKTMLSDM